MANKILIVGNVGSGKSYCTKFLNPNDTILITASGNILPFKGSKNKYKGDIDGPKKGNYFNSNNINEITKKLKYIYTDRKEIKNIIIDDFNYLVMIELMNVLIIKDKKVTFNAYSYLAKSIYDFISRFNNFNDDINVILTCHHILDEKEQQYKMKLAGKMLENHVSIEGLFSTILTCTTEFNKDTGETSHIFITNSHTDENGNKFCAKSSTELPLKMENDIYQVLKLQNKFYN